MKTAIVWLRQDLRSGDNPALAYATKNYQQVIPLYILDKSLVGGAQTWWLHHSLEALESNLKKSNLGLCLRQGAPLKELKKLIDEHQVDAVFWNRIYAAEQIDRDIVIKQELRTQGLEVHTFNGSLLNEPWTVLSQQKTYFKVFTPFWRQAFKQIVIPIEENLNDAVRYPNPQSDRLEDWQLLPKNPNWAAEFGQYWQPGEIGALKHLEDFIDNALNSYKEDRNIPSIDGTSHLSPYLHFGEISPWQIWRAIDAAGHHNTASIENFLTELGWREFAYYLLFHFPELPSKNFKSEFDFFPWKKNDEFLKCWQKGLTGYPIVDAGMRELWRSGYMHNRVRMICASFLVKDLFIDWREGAAWFMDTLVDADLASNYASWQWVAGSGVDAAPYFRIFNPCLQGEKFDPQGDYVRRWLPELSSIPNKWIHKPWEAPAGSLKIRLGKDYPYPIVDHKISRQYALDSYQGIKEQRGLDPN